MTWDGVDIGADDTGLTIRSARQFLHCHGLMTHARSSSGDTPASLVTSFRYGFHESLPLLQKFIHTLGRYTEH